MYSLVNEPATTGQINPELLQEAPPHDDIHQLEALRSTPPIDAIVSHSTFKGQIRGHHRLGPTSTFDCAVPTRQLNRT